MYSKMENGKKNIIEVKKNGPLELLTPVGLTINGRVQEIQNANILFCRCGFSNQKPFCDGAHSVNSFTDKGLIRSDYRPKQLSDPIEDSSLTIVTKANGQLRLMGSMGVRNHAGENKWNGNQANFCRCGKSTDKPFCDGSHLS